MLTRKALILFIFFLGFLMGCSEENDETLSENQGSQLEGADSQSKPTDETSENNDGTGESTNESSSDEKNNKEEELIQLADLRLPLNTEDLEFSLLIGTYQSEEALKLEMDALLKSSEKFQVNLSLEKLAVKNAAGETIYLMINGKYKSKDEYRADKNALRIHLNRNASVIQYPSA